MLMKSERAKKHMKTAAILFFISAVFGLFVIDNNEEDKADKLAKNQESFKSFVKSYASLDKQVMIEVKEFDRQADLVANGTGSRVDMYDQAHYARAAASEANSAIWELQVPSNLPKDVKKDLEKALFSARDLYLVRGLAMETAIKSMDNPKNVSLQSEFQNYNKTVDNNVSEITSSIQAAGQKLKLTPDEIAALLQ